MPGPPAQIEPAFWSCQREASTNVACAAGGDAARCSQCAAASRQSCTLSSRRPIAVQRLQGSKFPRRRTDYGGATGRASAKARASPRPKAPFGGRFFAVIADKGFVLVSEAIPVPSPISALSVYRHRWRHLLRDLN